jgi:formylglycine-generating enzyme required for sulfatase activity
MLPRLQDLYRTAVDPGLHAAVEWLLRHWHQEAWLTQVNDGWAKDSQERKKRLEHIGQVLTRDKDKVPQWYVNGQGQAMVVIPCPVDFVMGSLLTEPDRRPDESQHKRRIGRIFAVSAKPVTVNEFKRFLRANPKLQTWFQARGQAARLMKRYSPDPNGPIIFVDWYRAAAYCNWLSQQEGFDPDQWCYETNVKQLAHENLSVYMTTLVQHHPLAGAASLGFFSTDRFERVTKLKANYLSLTGYRLPTEAEWEYACRAGAVTARYYGESDELLPKYGWYEKNSPHQATQPVGSTKPNDVGLFDMHGNVYTWCQESFRDYPPAKDGSAIDDEEDILYILSENSRVLRGGSFNNHASNVRSAYHYGLPPTNRNINVGVRLARTVGP